MRDKSVSIIGGNKFKERKVLKMRERTRINERKWAWGLEMIKTGEVEKKKIVYSVQGVCSHFYPNTIITFPNLILQSC